VDDEGNATEKKEPKYPKIPIAGEKYVGKKLVKTKDSASKMFDITPDMIRGSILITASTNLNVSTLNEVEKEMKMTFFGKMAEIAQAYQINPVLEETMPLKKVVRDMAELYNVETKTGDDEELQKEKDKLYSEIQGMLPQNG
jgi:hypothetical protein